MTGRTQLYDELRAKIRTVGETRECSRETGQAQWRQEGERVTTTSAEDQTVAAGSSKQPLTLSRL